MASEKFNKVKEYSSDELAAEVKATEKKYQKMKFDHAVTGLENPLGLKEVRRDIARLYTEVRRRELVDASKEELAGRSKIRARRRK